MDPSEIDFIVVDQELRNYQDFTAVPGEMTVPKPALRHVDRVRAEKVDDGDSTGGSPSAATRSRVSKRVSIDNEDDKHGTGSSSEPSIRARKRARTSQETSTKSPFLPSHRFVSKTSPESIEHDQIACVSDEDTHAIAMLAKVAASVPTLAPPVQNHVDGVASAQLASPEVFGGSEYPINLRAKQGVSPPDYLDLEDIIPRLLPSIAHERAQWLKEKAILIDQHNSQWTKEKALLIERHKQEQQKWTDDLAKQAKQIASINKELATRAARIAYLEHQQRDFNKRLKTEVAQAVERDERYTSRTETRVENSLREKEAKVKVLEGSKTRQAETIKTLQLRVQRSSRQNEETQKRLEIRQRQLKVAAVKIKVLEEDRVKQEQAVKEAHQLAKSHHADTLTAGKIIHSLREELENVRKMVLRLSDQNDNILIEAKAKDAIIRQLRDQLKAGGQDRKDKEALEKELKDLRFVLCTLGAGNIAPPGGHQP